MNRNWWLRFAFLSILTIVSLASLVPTLFNLKENHSFPMKSKINLGLDLQGGLYMVMGIDFNKVYSDEVKNNLRKMELYLKDEGIMTEVGPIDLANIEDPMQVITIVNPQDLERARTLLKDNFQYAMRLANDKGTALTYGLSRTFKKDMEDNAIKKSIEVIRNRIDEFGVTEPEINSLGKDKIVVQLPGVKDIERAKELIGKTAKLEFKMVNDTVAYGTLQEYMNKAKAAGIEYKRGDRFSDYVQKINELVVKEIPVGHEIVFKKVLNKVNNEVEDMVPFVVESTARLTGEDLQDASVRIDEQENKPYVSMTFKSQGAKEFERVTGENIGRRLAIILDGNIYSDPVIQARIGGGNAQVTLGAGNYDDLMTEARDLALVLRAGALPVELNFEEQRVVGPSLGADSIKQSKISTMVACALVLLFTIFYYRTSGLIAAVTLFLNVAFILSCLVALEATLTLPGIAGIALTVGMAVDGNIIIFERIKEELAMGLSGREAMELGFNRAFWTLVDANLTTAAAGLMLLNFGTGPIRGFAVTLIIGIVCTIYTSYFVSRVLYELYVNKMHGKNIKI